MDNSELSDSRENWQHEWRTKTSKVATEGIWKKQRQWKTWTSQNYNEPSPEIRKYT